MDKNIVKAYVLELEAGNANASELQSTDLGTIGINLEEFCSKYNSVTNGENGIASVIIYVYDDGTYGFSVDSITPEFNEEETVVDNTPVSTSTSSSSGYSGGGYGGTSGGGRSSVPRQTQPSSTASNTGSTKKVGVNYDGVLSSVNNVINSINSTSSLQDGSGYSITESKSSIFDSVSGGGDYLKNVSSNLLYQISLGMNNVGTMLDNFKVMDSNLAKIADGLNDGLKQGLFGSPSSTISTDKIQSFESIVKNNTTLYDANISIGNAGKITLSELSSSIKAQTSALSNEISDASKMATSLDSLINSSDIQGSGWDAFKNILNKYKSCNDTRSKAAQKLLEAYESAEKIITDYISPDEQMDDGQIPEYEEKIAALEREIANCESKIASLQSENARLASVQPKVTYTYKEGKKITKTDDSAYKAAQAQIAANTKLIAEAQGLLETAKAAKEEAEIYLERLRGLAAIISKANQLINDAITEIESMYASEVYGINTPRLESLRNSGSLPESLKVPEVVEIPDTETQIQSPTYVPTIDPEKAKAWIKKYGDLGSRMVDEIPNLVTAGNPQGLAVLDKYLVGTSSDGYLYIFDRTTGKNQKMYLDKNYHLGGIGYKNGHLYVATNDSVTKYNFDELLKGNLVGTSYKSRTTTNNPKVPQVSFLTTTADGRVITGQFHKAGNSKYDRGGAASDLIVYNTDSNGNLYESGTIKIPGNMSQIQGACVYNHNGQDYYLLTSSYGIADNKKSTLYVATLNDAGTELVYNKEYTLPSGAEQVTVTNDGNIAVQYEGNKSRKNITVFNPTMII